MSAAYVGPVQMREHQRKGTLPFDPKGDEQARDVITERLYTCPNGLQLAARRGGRAHLADQDTWEIFVLDAWGIAGRTPDGMPDSVGWVDEATLARAVERLSGWGGVS